MWDKWILDSFKIKSLSSLEFYFFAMFSRFVCTRSVLNSSSFSRGCTAVQTRKLNIHEYQSQALMRKYNVTVPDGDAASSIEEAASIAKKLGLLTETIHQILTLKNN